MKTATIVAALSIAMTSAASAQDIFGANAFDGFYAGIFAEHLNAGSSGAVFIGSMAGVRFSPAEFLLAGIEVDGNLGISQIAQGTISAFVLAHAGVVAAENIALFAAIGPGYFDNGFPELVLKGVAGVEFAASDAIHLRAQVEQVWRDPSISIPLFTALKGGVVFQFN